jgi:hypothetical protein
MRTGLPGDNSEWAPPDPISNSAVKTLSADGSVGIPHVRVGHCQALFFKNLSAYALRFFFVLFFYLIKLFTSQTNEPNLYFR